MSLSLLRVKTTILLYLLSSLTGIVVGQSGLYDAPQTLKERIVSPNPDASLLQRHIDCNVSYATGSAYISVPLMEWNVGNMLLSIGISYDTKGERVYDIGGAIGTGWTLTGLGTISRSIRSLPDEWNNNKNNFNVLDGAPTIEQIESLLTFESEANYDRYYYNFPGYSGSFIVTKDGRIIQLPATPLTIERIANHDNSMLTDA